MAVVTVTEGKLKGGEAVTKDGFRYHEFISVPFAKPPIGELRFKSPQALKPWKNERDATLSHIANTSCQVNLLEQQFTGSEDCLYLNVYTPKLPSAGSKTLPVMVFIHGGGFIGGNGITKAEFGPDFLIQNNVVVVSINYRLSVLGFLNLGIPEAAGNMGLKDQVMALQWIQKNIEEFGGDKDNVTIFGISAGSASVEYLILSPKAKGLFHKAILQSGSSLNDWAINYRYNELIFNLLEKLSYNGNAEDKRAVLDFLLAVPAPLLAEAAHHVSEEFPVKSIFFGFVPTIEKDFGDAILTTNPYKLLKEGHFNKIPVMRGFCNKEGLIMFMLKTNTLNELTKKGNFVDNLSYLEGKMEKYNTKLSDVYKKKATDEDKDTYAIDFFGDLHFSAGVWVAAKLQARKGVPTYFYQFAYDGNLNWIKKMCGSVQKGACHGDDTIYVFTNEKAETTAEETDFLMRQKITKMWTNFAKTGEPSSSDLKVEWPKFTEESKSFLIIDKEFTVDSNYEPQRMAVFEEIYDEFDIL